MKFTTLSTHIMFLNNMGAQGIRPVINIMGYVRDIADRAYFTSCQLCIVTSTRLSFGLHILQTKRMYKWSFLKLNVCVFVLKYESEMWWKCWLCTGQLKSQLRNGQCSKCTIAETWAQLLGARVHVRIITTWRTHVDVAKEAYICKYKHLNQWFHTAHFCMKVNDIKHVMIALLEHFSRWIKLYYIHVLLISSIEWILQFANISLALHLKCKLNRPLIALLYVIPSLFICTFIKLHHRCEQEKFEQ